MLSERCVGEFVRERQTFGMGKRFECGGNKARAFVTHPNHTPRILLEAFDLEIPVQVHQKIRKVKVD